MIGESIFLAICMGGAVFLLYVLVGFWREDRLQVASRRRISVGSQPIVIPLPADSVFTVDSICPAGVPEKTPFTIVSSGNRLAAHFFVESQNDMSSRRTLHLSVNPHRSHIKRAR